MSNLNFANANLTDMQQQLQQQVNFLGKKTENNFNHQLDHE
jgi:hypothetical protein